MPDRLAAERALYGRWAGLLAFVYQKQEYDGSPAATNRPILPGGGGADPPGPVEVYNDPIGFALATLGLAPTDPTLVVDADLARVPRPRWFVFLDLAEYRLVRSTLGSFVDTNVSAQDRSQDWASLADRAQQRADDLEKQYQSLLNPVARRAVSGTIRWTPPTVDLPGFGPGYGRGPGEWPWGAR